MATIPVTTVTRSGIDPLDTDQAASAGGDEFANDGKTLLYVNNGDGSPITVTVAATSGKMPLSGTAGSTAATVDANSAHLIGPFPKKYFSDGSSNVQVTYSAVTLVTVLAIKLDGSEGAT